MKKIVVTGGLGFIGSNLIELLIKKKFYVINVDKGTYSSNKYNVKDFQKSNKISVIEDFKKDLGPLGGVFTAMKWIKDNNKDYQWVSTFPTDSPFFKNKILKDFFNEIHPGESKLFFIKSNNTRHNIFGLWSLELMNKLEEDLNKGERKVEVWANSVGVKVINMNFEKDDPFFNINTKEDLEKAKAKIGND